MGVTQPTLSIFLPFPSLVIACLKLLSIRVVKFQNESDALAAVEIMKDSQYSIRLDRK